jgi:hypothetical protein
MKTNSLLASAALAAALATAASGAHAAIITFDDPAGNAILDQDESQFSDQGLTFTGSGWYMYVYDGSNPNGNGTNANIFAGFSSGDFETITRTGGGAFSLNSIDLATSWYDTNSTDTVVINGAPLIISDTLTTYNLNLTDVTSVTISGVQSDSGYWLADNLNVAVPEPATWALMLVGFGGMGAMLRMARRRNAGALTAV